MVTHHNPALRHPAHQESPIRCNSWNHSEHTAFCAIVRGNVPDAALRTVLTLAEEGIEAIEVSLTTNDAPAVIARARTELGPEALVGAETVRTADDAARAVAAGASYLVTRCSSTSRGPATSVTYRC